ncbi:MAG: ATP-binding protein [Ignavibacteriales bacterium]|nr:ATP-binding protein [Ignavibacteriales bacterium]
MAIEAERSAWSFTRYLYTLAELELEERRQRRVQRRRQESGLPASKTLTTLQVAHLPTPVRRQLPTLCEGQFVEQAQNVLAFGLPGRGKTHCTVRRGPCPGGAGLSGPVHACLPTGAALARGQTGAAAGTGTP